MIKDLLKNKSSDPLQELLQRKFFENNINIELELGESAPKAEEDCGGCGMEYCSSCGDNEYCGCGKPDCPLCIQDDPDEERKKQKEESIEKQKADNEKGITESSSVYSNGYSDNKSL